LSSATDKLLSKHINAGGASNKGDNSAQTECPTNYGAWLSVGGKVDNNTALQIYGDTTPTNEA
jgi:hypothetical protein